MPKIFLLLSILALGFNPVAANPESSPRITRTTTQYLTNPATNSKDEPISFIERYRRIKLRALNLNNPESR
ncbi:hypothetical protein [Gloeocapsa sp. PCC 73106]|uniref:hypothetical protein n=1 Tax=Gloeocapsa sp. PCC 73106 TaxID=102232 RepID=UPI0002AC41B6|nr:hypothetical protein [Gloeocapsa sp. PCC 73106]ELR98715.1 hypothetical protein GLO73106DRAFT_00025530 [Gloeocapsa sp. PCC 73106]